MNKKGCFGYTAWIVLMGIFAAILVPGIMAALPQIPSIIVAIVVVAALAVGLYIVLYFLTSQGG